MIENIQGNIRINKLRLINISKVDCNLILNIYRGELAQLVIRVYSFLNGRLVEFLRVSCYRIVSLRKRVELQTLDKNLVRAELSSVEIRPVEDISDLKEYFIYVSLLLSHKQRGRKTNITTVVLNISSLEKQHITQKK